MSTQVQTDETQTGGVHSNPVTSTPSPTKKRKATKCGTDAHVKRRLKGRLSALPSLPLDILYEIFTRVGPAELLNLSRTNKAFRKLLLSRQSSFVWKDVLDAVDENYYPPRPEDMSELAWVNLVWGGPWCTTCGAKAPKVSWHLRRRFCKTCKKAHLTTGGIGPSMVSFEGGWIRVTSLLPSVWARTRESYNREKQHMWDEDLYQFHAACKSIAQQCSAQADRERALDNLIGRQKKLLENINKHADLCIELEDKRSCDRGEELSSLRMQRFKQAEERLVALGYDLEDIRNWRVRQLKELRVPKPLTDRGKAVIDDIRDAALQAAPERRSRFTERQDMLTSEYVTLLRRIDPIVIPFMPSTDNLLALPWIAAAVQPDRQPSLKVFEDIEGALYGSMTDIEQWVCKRFVEFRALIPRTWVMPSATLEDTGSLTVSALVNVNERLPALDLAVYVFRCTLPSSDTSPASRLVDVPHPLTLFGLEAVAHQCNQGKDRAQLYARPQEDGYNAACQILRLVGLDPRKTTVFDMDQLPRRYILCADCPVFLKRVVPMTWRDAVKHVIDEPSHDSVAPRFILLDPLQNLYVLLKTSNDLCFRRRADPIWGCSYCTAHFNRAHIYFDLTPRNPFSEIRPLHWFSYVQARKHLTVKHNIEEVLEGRDMFALHSVHSGLECGGELPSESIKDEMRLFMKQLGECPRVGDK
ncbi:hypothetical protein K488DRAFT_82124 [Vararia minispora EC-137]|uniref:Uncharacterized protein n=1 Tax=Vararia minispora EC-137 TaxID=1314806 RepID=A0ACB8QX70_9AGAM|nr:hypothetical protein K488DRAFT_82124 [Vararia minispora EC-137]